MKDMIKRIREEREGFTLAELLIVVAIIAVLVAIAIPIFNSQLEKSRDAVTVSNIRTAYAEAQTAYLTEQSDTTNGVTYTKATSTADATVTVSGVKAMGTSGDLSGLDADLPFPAASKTQLATDLGAGNGADFTLVFTYDKSTSALKSVTKQ